MMAANSCCTSVDSVLVMTTTTASEENGEFCVAVAPVTRTAGILT